VRGEPSDRLPYRNQYKDASGFYFDNDIGDFSEPHPDALDEVYCRKAFVILKKIIQK